VEDSEGRGVDDQKFVGRIRAKRGNLIKKFFSSAGME
jgi:hypothetical protein